jgi:multidrug efflux pump subunit AcrA (membrane-fusion protein)
MIRTGGVPGYPGHPDTKPEMDPRQRARMQKIIGTVTAFSQLAKEEAEAELAEAAAKQEWADVTVAEDELRHAKETGDQSAVEAAQTRLDEEREEAETAQRVAVVERKEAEAAGVAVAAEKARLAQDEVRRAKARPAGAPIPGRPGRPARWLKGEDLATYHAEQRSETQLAALMQISNNDPSLTYLDWSKMDLHDGVAQRLGNALRGNTHLRRLDLRFNEGFTDLACSCGKPDTAAASSLQRSLAQSSVRSVRGVV